MACLRTQGRLPKLPWLKNKKWGAVACPQLWDNAPAHWNVEPWRGPNTLDDRLSAEGQLLWGCEAQIALDLPCSTTSPPAYYHLPIPAVRPAHLQLPTSTRSPPWTPKNLVMPCPSGHHQSIHFIVFHRGVPQPPQTSLSSASSRFKLRLVVMLTFIAYIIGEVEDRVLYFLTSCEHWSDSPPSPASYSSSAPLVNRAGGSIYVVEAADCQCSAGGVVSTSSAEINSRIR